VLYKGFSESSKLISPFGMISQISPAFFPGSLQMVSEPPSNARSCGTRALHDMALIRTSRV